MSIQSPAKCETHSIIHYLVWKAKPPVEVYNEVKTAYGDKAMNLSGKFKLCREFKNKIVEKIENVLHDDGRLTEDELFAMFPQIPRYLLYETIREALRYRKLSAR